MKALLVSVLVSSATVSAQYSIGGLVTSARSGDPVVGAQCFIEETYAVDLTNADGEFRIGNLAQGKHTLVVRYFGYEEYRKVIDVYTQMSITVHLSGKPFLGPEVIVSASRADEKTPVTHSELTREQIEEQNLGKDLPFLLDQMPSTVVTSDAGTGVGYTSMRIRGSDITRINVTVNGIPINDAESHGVWWVDLPDIATSTQSIQVQRGVGTSALGAGAFGATVNLQTTTLNRNPYGELSTSYGAYNTWKRSASVGSGLVKNLWSFDARLSRITSDGYVDRATADLTSWYLSGAYHGRKNTITFNAFSGHEVTYQAWNGVPEDSLVANPTFNSNTYENEVDDYTQSHYQLLWSNDLGSGAFLNIAGHYTKGSGFFEQYRMGEDFADYGLTPVVVGTDTISNTDLIRRRWLDNDFNGVIASVQYNPGTKVGATVGAGWNNYDGSHFGEIIWARFADSSEIRDRYYDNTATKTDISGFGKINYQAGTNINLFADVQVRQVDYTFLGLDDSANPAMQNVLHTFINPKAGFTIDVGSSGLLYGSVAIANREPTRDDYVESSPSGRPDPENLTDFELGYKLRLKNVAAGLNAFYMLYKDQLVLSGRVNDVGAYTRTNVAESYRAGAELSFVVRPVEQFTWRGNFTYSLNQIPEFIEFIDNLDSLRQDSIIHTNTDIGFSPSIVAANQFTLEPIEGLAFHLITKFVGEQFLDNTSNSARAIDPYFTADFRINYDFTGWKGIDKLSLVAAVYNLLSQEYSSNGYTFSYISGGQTATENYFYPQAPLHWMLGASIRF